MHHPRRASDTVQASSAIPELTLLRRPLAAAIISVGQLVAEQSSFDTQLSDRDYDDIGSRWYKDVIVVETSSGAFTDSLGASHFVKRPSDGFEIGTIEAPEQRVRLLKDPEDAVRKALQSDDAREWLQKNKDAGFVVAIREVTNASYRRARLIDRGAGNWEVARDVGGKGHDGKRRDSGLEVQTRSKIDIVGLLVKKIVSVDGTVSLGGDFGTNFYA